MDLINFFKEALLSFVYTHNTEHNCKTFFVLSALVFANNANNLARQFLCLGLLPTFRFCMMRAGSGKNSCVMHPICDGKGAYSMGEVLDSAIV